MIMKEFREVKQYIYVYPALIRIALMVAFVLFVHFYNVYKKITKNNILKFKKRF